MEVKDLKTGHVLTFRCGVKGIVLKDCDSQSNAQIVFRTESGFQWIDLCNIKSGFKFCKRDSEWDVMKIEFVPTTMMFDQLFAGSIPWSKKVVWERKDDRADELRAIITKLSGQLKEAEKELANIV